MTKRITVDLNDFKNGTTAYFTKYFTTYRVEYAYTKNNKITAKIKQLVMIHKRAMIRSGVKRPISYEVGVLITVDPKKLWDVETEKQVTLLDRIIKFLKVG